MGRPRKWASDAERMAAYRAQQGGWEDPEKEEVKIPVRGPLGQQFEVDLTEWVDEQAVRDRYGYTVSETRTQAERQAAASRILERLGIEAAPQTREHAIEIGRRYGEETADQMGLEGAEREQRIRRAIGYAAWEYDGKPLGVAERYQKEFGIHKSHVVDSLERAAPVVKKPRS